MCLCADVTGFLVLVHCELPTSQSMGNPRKTSDVNHWLPVSISLEVFYDSLSGWNYVPFCYSLQGGIICIHWLALDVNDNMDSFYGKSLKVIN